MIGLNNNNNSSNNNNNNHHNIEVYRKLHNFLIHHLAVAIDK